MTACCKDLRECLSLDMYLALITNKTPSAKLEVLYPEGKLEICCAVTHRSGKDSD